jgi:hypothetical protein
MWFWSQDLRKFMSFDVHQSFALLELLMVVLCLLGQFKCSPLCSSRPG